MEINVTLVLQGIHFIVAWMLLKHVLLLPLFKCIESRQSFIASLKTSNRSQRDILNTLSQERNACISEYCHYFTSHAPSVSRLETLYFFTPTPLPITSVEVKEEVIEKRATHLTTTLITQLKQVRV